MTLKVIIDTVARDALGSDLQSEYVKLEGQDGMFILDTTPHEIGSARYALEDVSGLRASLEAARNERDTHKTAAGKFKNVDLAEYQRLIAKKAEIDGWDPSNDDATKTRIEEANASMQTKYDTDLGEANKKADVADGKYRQFLKQSVAQAAIASVAPDSVRVLLPHVLPLIDVFPTDDPNVDAVWVRGEGGKPRITQVAGKTGNMLAIELVTSMKDDKDFMDFFPGTGATGSGATGGGKGTGKSGSQTASVEGLSPVERLKAARRAQHAG